jgi:chloramphenicol O-acetyltransferase type A
MKEFDIHSWNRKSQYDFFKTYDDPFFNLTTELDVTNLYDYCKKNQLSFFLACLHFAVESANEILEFRLRIVDDTIFEFEHIDIGSTVLNEDNTFSFCYFKRKEDVFAFDINGKSILKKHSEEDEFDSNKQSLNLIYASSVPWISFTSIKHARSIEREKSGIPKFVFGKFSNSAKAKKMPFSIEVHHALMDGYHVGKFLEIFQKKIDEL